MVLDLVVVAAEPGEVVPGLLLVGAQRGRGIDQKPAESRPLSYVPSVKGYGSCCSVDGDELAGVQAVGGVAGSDDGGDAVLAGDEGGVGGESAAVGDNRGGAGEQRRPGWCGRLGDEDVAVG
jgi:hypothetical protein